MENFFLQCPTEQTRIRLLVGLGGYGLADGAPVLLPEPVLDAGDVVVVLARHLAHLLPTRVLLLAYAAFSVAVLVRLRSRSRGHSPIATLLKAIIS